MALPIAFQTFRFPQSRFYKIHNRFIHATSPTFHEIEGIKNISIKIASEVQFGARHLCSRTYAMDVRLYYVPQDGFGDLRALRGELWNYVPQDGFGDLRARVDSGSDGYRDPSEQRFDA